MYSINCINIGDYLTSSKLNHSLAVSEKASKIKKFFYIGEFEVPLLLTAAKLHNIGESDKLKRTGFAQLDGYLFLKGSVDVRIASTVLLHSSSLKLINYQHKEIQYLFNLELQNLKKDYYSINKTLIDIITISDMLVDNKGNLISPVEKYKQLANKYGIEDYRTITFKEQMIDYGDIL